MKNEPVWLSRQFLDAAHNDQLQQHGGLPGIRDENALESALNRPQNRWMYEPETCILELAASYCFGLATSHCNTDGNKRTAFIALFTFLGLNDVDLTATQPEVVGMMLKVAGGSLNEKEITDWLATCTEPFSDDED